MEYPGTRCVVALGTNLGDRHDIAFKALADLQATEGFFLVAASKLHETVALGATGPDETKPGYLNQIILVNSAWSPTKTLEHLHAIENDHGRIREGERYADRTLDLDLITYGDLVVAEEGLVLPHPRAHERRFVLEPWLELDPEAVVPSLGTVASLLESLPADTP